MSIELITALTTAVQAQPESIDLRIHLAELLISDDRAFEAVPHCAVVLSQDPSHAHARQMMVRALAKDTDTTKTEKASRGDAGPAQRGFDWQSAEQEFPDAPAPMYVEDPTEGDAGDDESRGALEDDIIEVETSTVRLCDVGGMEQVKRQLEAAFLAPLRHPELSKAYGQTLRGGLMLYGPPGCGKTYLARALAGELGASFINVTLTDVLDMYVGNSEANLSRIFTAARRTAPVVVFLDEIDAMGQRRSHTRMSATRGVVNQLLQELDGVGSDNAGVYVLAATNTPWDVDPALRRPGRFDRTCLVTPPDENARAAILRSELDRRPVEGIRLGELVTSTKGLTGADLAHLCNSAAQRALMDSVESGQVRAITMDDLTTTLRDIRPSTGGWFDIARNVVTYSDRSGDFDELRDYMKKYKLL